MSAFIRRVRDSFVRRSPGALTTQFPLTTSAQDHRRFSYDAHSSDEEGDSHSDDSETSLALLPVIRDMGPPTSNRYADPDIFWNSTMIEGDEADKDRRGMELPGNVRRKAGDPKGTSDTKADSDRKACSSKTNVTAEEVGSLLSASEIAAARQQRHDSHGLRQLERNIHYGRERADNDLSIIFYVVPDYRSRPDNSSEQRSSNVHISPGTTTTTDISEQHQAFLQELENATQQFDTVQSENSLRDPLPEDHSSTSECGHAPQLSAIFTWNMCLNQILRGEALDPSMKQLVEERIKSGSTTNGNGEGGQVYVSTNEAALVPNFSYPVVRSLFFDRLIAEETPLSILSPAVTRNHVAVTNLEQEQWTSTVTDHWLEFDFGFNRPRRSASPERSTSSDSSSSNLSSAPPGSDIVVNCMTSLLKEVLTPSELDLYYCILEDPFNPASNPPPSRLQTRLTLALHTLIYHLQDRISHVEDTLLPQLATALEHKTTTIDNLGTGLQSLDDQISDLQGVVNFGTRILGGCWARECEIRETLVDIRRNRLGSFPRWWSSIGKVSGDILATPGQGIGKLKDSELDALVLMAEQNLLILGGDREDMIEQVERYMEVYRSSPAFGRSDGS